MGLQRFKTCKRCGFDNPYEGSNACNNCGSSLRFSNYIERWVCPTCNAIVVSKNTKCHSCGKSKPTDIGDTIFAILFIIALFLVFGKK